MPGAKCTICPHPERGNAERAIASGVSVRAAAKQFGLPYASLDRHQRNCAPKAIAKARAKTEAKLAEEVARVEDAVSGREEKLAAGLVERVETLQRITDQIIRESMQGMPYLQKDGSLAVDGEGKPLLRASHGLALKAIAQARKNLELIGRLTGTLEPETGRDTQLITFEEFSLLYRRVRLENGK